MVWLARLMGRLALVAAAAALVLALGVAPRGAGAQTVAERKSVTELTPAEIMSLRRGVARMMSRNTAGRSTANFRRSWVFWANLHSHYGSTCRGPVTGPDMEGVRAWAASNTAERATWCRCEHGTDLFLPWHRMALWYFERVLQQAAGDTQLRLPYWDYVTDPELPEAFRAETYVNEAGRTVPNPLRVAARRPGLNDGTAGIAQSVATASGAMGAATYGAFRTRLERTPHGAVHCAIGAQGCPGGLMGSVPASALDPIFWLHHANVDRLYECWLQADEAARLPSSPQILDTRYSFIDRDGSTRQRRVRDMLRTSQLGYRYSAGGGDCQAPTALSTLVADVAPTTLNRGLTRVPLAMEPDAPPAALARGAAPQAATARGASAAARPAAATVVIEGLTFDEGPGVLYNVYLQNAAGDRAQIGVVDFFGFGAEAPAAAHGGSHEHDAGARRFEFDATEAVASLGLGPGDEPSLVFEPTTGLTTSEPAAAAELISPEANVRFDSARIRFGR